MRGLKEEARRPPSEGILLKASYWRYPTEALPQEAPYKDIFLEDIRHRLRAPLYIGCLRGASSIGALLERHGQGSARSRAVLRAL